MQIDALFYGADHNRNVNAMNRSNNTESMTYQQKAELSGAISESQQMKNMLGVSETVNQVEEDQQNRSYDKLRDGRQECETCKKRKYQDGSDEMDVSFKTAQHVSPENAGAAVRAHEQMHVSNAYEKAEKGNGRVLRASVSIETAICPECGRVYVAGGKTRTAIAYQKDNPYQKNADAIADMLDQGVGLDRTS